MNSLEIYLTFEDQCEAAFNFYAEVFSGEITWISRFSEMPPDPAFPVTDAIKNQVMHATLQLKPGVILMGSDSGGREIIVGNNYTISVNAASREEVDQFCAALSDGGAVSMPPQEQFWGSYFALCTDKFGINWMFSFELTEQQQ